MKEGVERIRQLVEQWSPEDLLRWAFVTFGGYVEIASGFGPEGVVLIDIAARVQPSFRIFTLDTDFLFPETYRLMEQIEKRYGIRVERVKSTLTPEDQERLYGPALWGRDPDACCNLRKVAQEAVGVASVGYQHPSRADPGPRRRAQGRVGREISPSKNQPAGRLDHRKSLALHP